MEILGELIPDKDIPEWLVSRPVGIPYLQGQTLRFILENLAEDPAPEEFEAAVRNFLSLTTSDCDLAAPHVYRNLVDFVEAVSADDVDGVQPTYV